MIKQLGIILGMLGVGHIIVALTGVRIPASILGMILLAILLKTRRLAEGDVSCACQTIISNLGFFFIPPGVALMIHYRVILAEWPAILVSTVGSTLLVMIVTGLIHSWLSRKKSAKDERVIN